MDSIQILIEEIRGLAEDGFSIAEIAWGLNLRKSTVRTVLRSA